MNQSSLRVKLTRSLAVWSKRRRPSASWRLPFAVGAVITTLSAARADLVIQQRIEGAGQTGTVTTLRMRGMKLRVDIPSRAGLVSSVMDLETGDSMTLMHGQKLVTRIPAAQTKETTEALRKKVGKVPSGESSTKAEATGRKEKVGEFNAEIFVWKTTNAVQTIWVTKDLPNYAKVKEQFDRLSKSSAAQAQKGLSPDLAALPGVVVKTEIDRAGQKFSSTVLSVKEEDLNPALFEAPVDYRDTAKKEKTDPVPSPPEPERAPAQ